ncbi:MAG TPA: SHOCT domain-containing protein [Bacteroidota bacterium]
MPYQVSLSSDEKVINQITQDLAGKAFFFWRKFTVTLTNKHLHAYQKLIISHGQKTFDLRDLDSIYQERRFNGGYSFFFGLIVYAAVSFLGMIILPSAFPLFNLIGIAVWVSIFILYFFRRLLIVRSRNDQMSIDVIRMPEHKLSDFVQSVLQQKELVVGEPPAKSVSPSLNNAEERLKQLSQLRTQGLITEQEFETKKKEVLKSL